MKNSHGTYYCTVIIDTIKDRVVGASTLLMERKFIRGCALVSCCHMIIFLIITVKSAVTNLPSF